MAAILAREPDLNALPIGLNPRLLELLNRCLEKTPKRRWQAVGDLRAELEAIVAAPRMLPVAGASPSVPLWRRAAPIIGTALVAITLTSSVWWSVRPSGSLGQVMRFTMRLPEGQQLLSNGAQLIAISRDGGRIAYYATRQLHVRTLSEPGTKTFGEAVLGQVGLPGNPAFSPDGQSILIWVGTSPTSGAFKRIALAGGSAVTVCEAGFPFGVSWDERGIFFGQPGGIMRVSQEGGRPELILPVTEGVVWGPQLLPDGDTLLYTLATTIQTLQGATPQAWDRAHIVAHSLKSGKRKTLVDGGTGGRYVASGHILYAVSGVLFAVPFDARRVAVTGPPVPVVEGVGRPFYAGAAPGTVYYVVSDSGSLIYIGGPPVLSAEITSLAFVDRQQATTTTLNVPPAAYVAPRVSPNGRQLAVEIDTNTDANIWIYDLAGTIAPRQLTLGGRNRYPLWSPDGTFVAFQSNREGDLGIFRQTADGARVAERLTKPDRNDMHVPDAWSSDGQTILYEAGHEGVLTLRTLSLRDGQTARFSDAQSGVAMNAAISPDGRWIAYRGLGADSGAIVVEPFPATGAKYRMGPGIYPLWSRDGLALFFVRALQLQQVSVTTQPAVAFGLPSAIRSTAFTISSPVSPRSYDLMPAGDRFIVTTYGDQTQSAARPMTEIQMVVNWFTELQQRVPISR